MTRAARGRHRATLTALAVALPVLTALAVAARPPRPMASPRPAGLAPAGVSAPGATRIPVAPSPGADAPGPADWPLTARLVRRGDGTRRVEWRGHGPLRRPDVLLYWSPAAEAVAVGDAGLPEDVWLLGEVAGTAWQSRALPEAARDRPGQLLLYSLGHARVLARRALDLAADDGPAGGGAR